MGLGFRGWEVEYDDDGGDCGLDDTLGPAISDCGGGEGASRYDVHTEIGIKKYPSLRVQSTEIG